MSSTTTTPSYNSSIPNHFAVMCVMEDLIGSPDAESETAMIESRARAVSQLSGLANTMGKDWCENEIVPYLMRLALEDEKSVSLAAAAEVCDLCETKFFSKSVEMQESLILSVGVGFLTSAHLDVRLAALDSVRRACLIFARNNNNKMLLMKSKSSSSSSISNSTAIKAASSLLTPTQQKTVELEGCRLLLRVVHRLLFETAFPTSISSGLLLLSPCSIQLTAALPPFQMRPFPLLTRESINIIQELFSNDSLLTQLRLETAICGGSGRVMVIDAAIVTLTKNLLVFAAASSSSSSSTNNNGTGDSNNNNNNDNNIHDLEDVFFAIDHLIDYLLEHVFSVSCPSAIFLEKSLNGICVALKSFGEAKSSSSATSSLLSPSSSLAALLRRIEKNFSLIFSKIIRDWSRCEDWGVRFEIAKHSSLIFDSMIFVFVSASSSTMHNTNNNNKTETAANHHQSSSSFSFFEMSMEVYHRVLPSLMNDNETEVTSAAAGTLPEVVSSFEKFSQSPSGKKMNLLATSSSSSSSDALIRRVFSSENEKFSQELSVQEAVANSLGEAMRGTTQTTTISSNTNNPKDDSSNIAKEALANTAQSTLSEMLATCQDDGVRVSIVESLLWSSVVESSPSNKSNSNNHSHHHQALRAALDHLTDVPHSTATSNPEFPQTTVTSWRIREQLGEATGKMISKILLDHHYSSQQRNKKNSSSTTNTTTTFNFTSVVVDLIINPFVRLLFDRFTQVRSSCLSQLVKFLKENSNNINNNTTTSSSSSSKPESLLPLWNWILQFKPTAARAPHYQTRVAFISAALVCASEKEFIQILENASRDKVVNVRRAVALALAQGNDSNNNNNNNNNRQHHDENMQQNNESSSSSSSFNLVPEFKFSWSSNLSGKVFELLEKLVSDESSDVREAAVAGLSRCS